MPEHSRLCLREQLVTMMYLILLAVVAACILAEPAPQFQHNRYNQGRYNPFYNRYDPYNFNNRYRHYTSTFKPFVSTTAAPLPGTDAPLAPVIPNKYYDGKVYGLTDEKYAQILRFDNDATPGDGFHYSYETSNGIATQAVGTPRNLGGVPPNTPLVIDGSFSWVSPEGKVISISYVVDENGYQPVGDAIPTPPPIPEAILRAIEYNRQYSRPGKSE